ncbi:MAG: M91 family zinc metallopeptidase [Pyrinomonadaceae bacterium]
MAFDTPTNYRGIIIRMNNESDSVYFPTLVTEALNHIAETQTGRTLLAQIDSYHLRQKSNFTVCINRADMTFHTGCSDSWWTGYTGWQNHNKARRVSEFDAVAASRNAIGSSTTNIIYNPNIVLTPDGFRPSWIGLAHELIHAYYNLIGQGFPSELVKNVKADIEREEAETVGLGKFTSRNFTENMIRAEAGLKQRVTYGGL